MILEKCINGDRKIFYYGTRRLWRDKLGRFEMHAMQLEYLFFLIFTSLS